MKALKRLLVSVGVLVSFLSLEALPVINSVAPATGPVDGGTNVTLTGTGFSDAVAVQWGNIPAVSFTVVNDTTITAVTPANVPSVQDIFVCNPSEMSTPHQNDKFTYTQDGGRAIVSVYDPHVITTFNTADNALTSSFATPFASPRAAVTPDGTRLYLVNEDAATIDVIEVATQQVIGSIATSVGLGGFDIIVSPNGKTLYVTNDQSGYVTVIDTLTHTVVTNIFIGGNLGPIAVSPDGEKIYISNFSDGNVYTIETSSNTVIANVFSGAMPGMISITPDGLRAYIANSLSNNVTILDLASNTIIGGIPTNPGSFGSAITPDGKKLYVANVYSNTVDVIDVANNVVVTTLSVASGPFWAVATPDGKTVYIVNSDSNDVTPIDVATDTVGAAITNFSGKLQHIVISPDQAPLANFTISVAAAGTPSSFEASSSQSPVGKIETYTWDFGDGCIFATDLASVEHTYLSTGNFKVILSVTNSAGTSTAKVFSSRSMSNNGDTCAEISQEIIVKPLPPVNFEGTVKISNYLLWKSYKLVATWLPSATLDVVSYNIYLNGVLVDTVSASADLNYSVSLKNTQATGYEITAVGLQGTESAPIPLHVL